MGTDSTETPVQPGGAGPRRFGVVWIARGRRQQWRTDGFSGGFARGAAAM